MEVEQKLQAMTKSARKQQAELLSAPVNTWLWRAKLQPAPKPVTKSVQSPEEKAKELLGPPRFTSAAVGLGEDWSHLNKRRQRARKAKVQRDVVWMWKLQNATREAMLQQLNLDLNTTPRIGTSTSIV